METSTNEEYVQSDVCEVRLSAGLPPEGVEAVLELAANSGLFSSDALMAAEDMAWDTAYGDGDEPHTFLLANVDEGTGNRPVGFICFGPIPQWPQDYEMYGIAVDPEFQRQGIGSALIAEMKRQISLAGGKRVFLETGMERAFEGARAFYEANEFGQETRFYRQFIPNQGGAVFRFELDADDVHRQQ